MFWKRVVPLALATVCLAAWLTAVSSAGAARTCTPGVTHGTACPLTHRYSGDLPGNGSDARHYFKLWARAGTRIKITVENNQTPNCGPSDGGCVVVCGAYAEISNYKFKCSSDLGQGHPARPASFRVVVARTGVQYLTVNTEEVLGNVPVPFTLSVKAKPRVRWPPPR